MAHILLVDDSQDAIDTMRGALVDAGHTISAFQDPDNALEEARRANPPFDVAIVDIRLWGEQDHAGVMLATALRATDAALMLILVTGGNLDRAYIERSLCSLRPATYIPKHGDWIGQLVQAVARPVDLPQLSQKQLLRVLKENFDGSEIREICFELDIPYEQLHHEPHSELVIDLLQYCERHQLTQRLGRHILTKRPHLRL